nr:MAG TPA: hypothetical protein [Caudoviricetes sp.]DAV63147.1 MAG TPA: hypothetical protein [Caudoviricetes sp.]DAY81526.1 MAG TPA: hypothetical protein [Caudoviricetes sp.]
MGPLLFEKGRFCVCDPGIFRYLCSLLSITYNE